MPQFKTTFSFVSRYLKVVIVVFTLLIALSLAWNISNTRQETTRLAELEANTNLNKDRAFRLWATRHGGAYFKVDKDTQPSIFLSHISDRDVKTDSGKVLTLYNPATMLRDIMHDYSKLYGVKTRITAELYLNPENAPDVWEAQALKKLKAGAKTVKEITSINGKPYLRVMHPMPMEQGCLKCHAWTKIPVGGLHGATDVAIDLDKYTSIANDRILKLILTHSIIWLIGIGITLFLGRRLRDKDAILQTNKTQLSILSEALEQSGNGVMITDAEGIIQYINKAFEKINGFKSAELIGMTPRKMKSHLNPISLYENMWSTISKGETWRGEFKNRKKNGTVYWCYETISPIVDEEGKVTHYVGIVEDIEARKIAETHIKQLAKFDTLTNLPNRNFFHEKLNVQLLEAAEQTKLFSLIYIDLDRFKMVNDSLGHSVGDILLSMLSERLMDIKEKNLFISRLGGDEFSIITPLSDSITSIEDDIRTIQQCINEPFFILENDIFMTASIGIAVYPKDGTDAETLIKSADMAMYGAKIHGKNKHLFFEPIHGDFASETMLIENGLRKAIANDELFLVYQPKWDTHSNQFLGLEVLVRWQSPTLGFMNPGRFISIAEETDLIIVLGEWILRQALIKMVDISHVIGFVPKISVNVSPIQFRHDGFNTMVKQALDETNFPPQMLELEITEGALVHDPDMAIDKMNRLCKYGVTFSIDDFGTGYSSMSYLKKFPVSTLKIDKSFVDDIIDDPHDRAIIQAIITLADSFEINTIAEGAETQEQVAILQTLGCYAIQGYWHSRPLEYPALLDYFKN